MAERRALAADGAPRALGPYSQAVVAGDLVFCAGQVGLDPASARLVAGGIEAETARAIENLAAVLAAAGLGLGDVVKTTVFLADLGEFAAMNAVYGRYFTAPYPARATVQVAALPAGARVEIEAIAFGRPEARLGSEGTARVGRP
jgi:2-iminobutanoate/2-iminopropanoate deaminase